MQAPLSMDYSLSFIPGDYAGNNGTMLSPIIEKIPPQTPPSRRYSSKTLWTESETNALFLGIQKHGVGSWKAILADEDLNRYFHPSRSEVSLKDRYRVVWGSRSSPKTIVKPKLDRRKRRKWTSEEDQEVLKWFEVLGAHWTAIAKKSELLRHNNRSGIDVRDRVRNKYPNLYMHAPAVSNRKLSTMSAPELPLSYYSPASSTPNTPSTPLDFSSPQAFTEMDPYNFHESSLDFSHSLASYASPPPSQYLFQRISLPSMHLPSSLSTYTPPSQFQTPPAPSPNFSPSVPSPSFNSSALSPNFSFPNHPNSTTQPMNMNFYDVQDPGLPFFLHDEKYQRPLPMEVPVVPSLNYNDTFFLPSIKETEFDAAFQKRT